MKTERYKRKGCLLKAYNASIYTTKTRVPLKPCVLLHWGKSSQTWSLCFFSANPNHWIDLCFISALKFLLAPKVVLWIDDLDGVRYRFNGIVEVIVGLGCGMVDKGWEWWLGLEDCREAGKVLGRRWKLCPVWPVWPFLFGLL